MTTVACFRAARTAVDGFPTDPHNPPQSDRPIDRIDHSPEATA